MSLINLCLNFIFSYKMTFFLINLLCYYLTQLGGPHIEMKTGRRDSKGSYLTEVENFIPNHNDSMSLVLSRFQSVGVDTEGTVALLGKLTMPPKLDFSQKVPIKFSLLFIFPMSKSRGGARI